MVKLQPEVKFVILRPGGWASHCKITNAQQLDQGHCCQLVVCVHCLAATFANCAATDEACWRQFQLFAMLAQDKGFRQQP